MRIIVTRHTWAAYVLVVLASSALTTGVRAQPIIASGPQILPRYLPAAYTLRPSLGYFSQKPTTVLADRPANAGEDLNATVIEIVRAYCAPLIVKAAHGLAGNPEVETEPAKDVPTIFTYNSPPVTTPITVLDPAKPDEVDPDGNVKVRMRRAFCVGPGIPASKVYATLADEPLTLNAANYYLPRQPRQCEGTTGMGGIFDLTPRDEHPGVEAAYLGGRDTLNSRDVEVSHCWVSVKAGNYMVISKGVREALAAASGRTVIQSPVVKDGNALRQTAFEVEVNGRPVTALVSQRKLSFSGPWIEVNVLATRFVPLTPN